MTETTETADLVRRLRTKAGMLRMGEPIAWGSDADAIEEAADIIDRITRERDEARDSRRDTWRKLLRLWDIAEGYDPDDDDDGPRCRDCADEDGTCPNSGLPCDPQEAAEKRIALIHARIAKLEAALLQCAHYFQAYAAGHANKGDTDKAKRNQDRADAARAALEDKP
jgi:hypothetical protein